MGTTFPSPDTSMPSFRHGPLPLHSGTVLVRHGILARKKPFKLSLKGQVLYLYPTNSQETVQIIEVQSLQVTQKYEQHIRAKFGNKSIPYKPLSQFQLTGPDIILTAHCKTIEEASKWYDCLRLAQVHDFEDFYSIIHMISGGGNQKIFLVHDIHDESKVFAMKETDKKALSGKLLDELTTERHFYSFLNNRFIIKVVDIFSSLHKDRFVFELLAGGTLKDYLLRKRYLSEKETRRLFCDLAKALIYLHSREIIHCEINPTNILLTDLIGPPCIQLGGFGRAVCLSQDHGIDLMRYYIIETPYTSPDILTGSYTCSSDMFSAGVVLYEMLCGELPYAHDVRVEERKSVKLRFNGPIWTKVSGSMKDLLRGLLSGTPRYRPSARQALCICEYEDPNENYVLGEYSNENETFINTEQMEHIEELDLEEVTSKLTENEESLE